MATLPAKEGSVKRIQLTHSVKNNPIGYQDLTEGHTLTKCKVSGTIPAFLQGYYYKQSGVAFNSAHDTALLDGLAGIVSFKIDGRTNSARFSNAILDQKLSREYLRSEGRVRTWVSTASQAESDGTNLLDKARFALTSLAEWLTGSDARVYNGPNPNVVVWKLTESDGTVFPAAATEGDGTVLKFDKETLKTLGPLPTMKLDKGMIITTPAHYYETESGTGKGPYHVALEMETNGYFPPEFTFRYGIYRDSTAPLRRVGGKEIARFSYSDRGTQPLSKRPGYMHCYAQTENYLILFVSRMRLDYVKLLARDFSKGFFGLFEPSDVPLELMVFRIKGQANGGSRNEVEYVDTFSDKQSSPTHIWHMSNAYEVANGGLVIDASATNKIGDESFMMRMKLSLETGELKCSRLAGESGLHLEFPQVNPLVNFNDYHFSYALHDAGTTQGCLVKLDVKRSEVVAKAYQEDGYLLAEPVFVPRLRKYGKLSPEEEEDGVVLLTVTDTNSARITGGKSWLAILNPSDLSEIARIESPITINAGLHSHFYPDEPLICKI